MKKTNYLAVALSILMTMPVAAQKSGSMEQLHARAANASTTAQHAAVARDFRLQAEAFGEAAAVHEKEAASLVRSMGAMYYKWPSMAPRALQRAKDSAVESRRAEQEARQLADHHIRLAVEAQALASN